MRYIFVIIILAATLFIPFMIKSGTNINVLVNNGCGPVPGKQFTVTLNNGQVVSGITDQNGKWSATINAVVNRGVYESDTMILSEWSTGTTTVGVREIFFQEYTASCAK